MATRRYAAFLRGVSPMNARMPELRRAFEAAGFADVTTLRSSGNVLFGARGAEDALERRAEAAMREVLGRSFLTIIRPLEALLALLAEDPYAAFRLPPGSKRVVTFLREAPRAAPRLPIAADGARILAVRGREAFSAYVPGPRGPAFMALIERTFGEEVTTRTWETVERVAAPRPAGASAAPRRRR
jgi:uncharacterized protein (DUF1697 family)